MRITEVKTYMAATLRQNWLFVKVVTDEGVHGWGEASLEGQEPAVEQMIRQLAERSVIGEDPRCIERIWQKLYRHGFWKGGFIHMSAISGIDQALWDILGKLCNVPVYMLLGGAVRDRIRTYTHAGDAESARQAIEMGFAGIKTGGGKPGAVYDPQADLAFLDENLAAIRQAIGRDRILCIDNHGQGTPAEAIRQIEVAAKYNIHFFEEPIPPENTAAYRRIRDNSGSVPIAAGERLFTRFDYREAVEQQLFDFVQPDICHCGGITEMRKIAAMIEPYHMKLAPHNPNGPVATAASMHVSAATQHFDILEFAAPSLYARQDLYNVTFKPVDGYFALPEGPGLGIELDEEALARYPYTNIQYEARYGLDGSAAEI